MRAPALADVLEIQADGLMGGWREGGCDVAALSLNHETKPVDETLVTESHGSWQEIDPRYVKMQQKYEAEHQVCLRSDPDAKQHSTAYPACGDSMGIDELEALLARARQLAQDGTLCKKLRNFLVRLADGGIKKNDMRRWLPVIARMRADGRLT